MLWFLYNKNKLLIKLKNNQVAIPNQEDITGLSIQVVRKIQISGENVPCYTAEFNQAPEALPDGFVYMNLRKLFYKTDERVFGIAGRAYQILHWARTHQYCGRCGSLIINKGTGEPAKICPNCGLTSYPRISPAVIVAIVKDEQLLLASNKNFPTSFYSVLAGFVEPGETLETCVQREIKEEVGIAVKNITYFGSQPWPFPDSLMIGFTAEYAGGEITVDNTELATADWFARSQLPDNVPDNKTIAGRLIEWFAQKDTHGIYLNKQK